VPSSGSIHRLAPYLRAKQLRHAGAAPALVALVDDLVLRVEPDAVDVAVAWLMGAKVVPRIAIAPLHGKLLR